MLKNLIKDVSLSAISAGFIAVLVGFASAMAIVFQAAVAAGANQQQIESWVWALGIGMGVSTLLLSVWYKRPIIIAWSTPGAALLATSLTDGNIQQATGTFIIVGLMIILVGMSGVFNRITQWIPMPLAAAMLAGILVQFGLDIFVSMQKMPYLILGMLITFVIGKRRFPRYAIPLVLLFGLAFCALTNNLHTQHLNFALAKPEWITPSFSLASIVGVGIPLLIVTMTSQNLPGVAILKSSGYADQPVSPVITSTGITTLLLAPFGGFTFNLAAITAAICTSDESHQDPKKRYIAGVSVGVFNIIAGVLGTAVVGLFSAFPVALIAALAGLALLSTIGTSLHLSLSDTTHRDAALLTFLFTASGVTFWGISSAFWGIVLGLIWLHSKVKQ